MTDQADTNNMVRFRTAMHSLGFSDEIIDGHILPDWWDSGAAATPAGLAEAMVYAARYTGIDYFKIHSLVYELDKSK